MQMVINPLGKGSADALHPGQITDAGLQDALQAAELTQQGATALWSNSGTVTASGAGDTGVLKNRAPKAGPLVSRLSSSPLAISTMTSAASLSTTPNTKYEPSTPSDK